MSGDSVRNTGGTTNQTAEQAEARMAEIRKDPDYWTSFGPKKEALKDEYEKLAASMGK